MEEPHPPGNLGCLMWIGNPSIGEDFPLYMTLSHQLLGTP
jgi:hypothetical protein